MTRGGPTGVGSDPGSPTSISIIYRSRGMTSPDPEIDGGLPWIRGVDPAAGTRPGSRQDPAQEPTPKPPGSRGGSDPATNLGTDFTEEKPALEPTSRKRNPAAFQKCYVAKCTTQAALPFSRRRPCLCHHGKLFCAHRIALSLPQGKPPFPTDEQNSPLVSTKSGRCFFSDKGAGRFLTPQPDTSC